MEEACRGVIQKRNSASVPPSVAAQKPPSAGSRAASPAASRAGLEAAADLQQAGRLYRQGGNDDLADQLDKAANSCATTPKPNGNGWGSAILGGAAGLFKQLLPALKLMGPVFFRGELYTLVELEHGGLGRILAVS